MLLLDLYYIFMHRDFNAENLKFGQNTYNSYAMAYHNYERHSFGK